MSASSNRAQENIDRLGLAPHPEGGHYVETFRSDHTVDVPAGTRSAMTSIYFQLQHNQVSRFHRLAHEEIWCWHEGGSATIHMIMADGTYATHIVGPGADEAYSAVIPAGCWFGATTESSHVLVSAIVAPGFDFADFELADQQTLLDLFPDHADIIRRLT